MDRHPIRLKKVYVHNLKGVDLELTTGELILFTGVSGSGKSSMAFDTLYVEGQRRYIESLSTFAKRALGAEMQKPQVESVSGLSPTLAIEQKSVGKNPRSTVGTLTEIHDHLRLLFTLIGQPYCPISGQPVSLQSKESVLEAVLQLPRDHRLMILAPYIKDQKGELKDEIEFLVKKGFTKAVIDGELKNLDEPQALDKKKSHELQIVIDRLKHTPDNDVRLTEAIFLALDLGKGMIQVIDLDHDDQAHFFSIHAYSKEANTCYPPLEASDFSFNHPRGMCESCQGLGQTHTFDLKAVIDPHLSLSQNCCIIAPAYETVRYGNIYRNLADIYGFSVDTPWSELSEKARQIFLYGTEKKWTKMIFEHPEKGTQWVEFVHWQGVIAEANSRYAQASSDAYRAKMQRLMTLQTCPACHGSRLKSYPSAARCLGYTFFEWTHLPIEELYTFVKGYVLTDQQLLLAQEVQIELIRKLRFLVDVGLGYLTLDRAAPTLSGGEGQRVRLAAQIGSGLVGVTYILDEPSIGLHPRDNTALIRSLKHLRDSGNTVIVVEHDEETMRAADRIVDFGPGPGRLGGQILVNGTFQELLQHPTSLTAQYLRGDKKIGERREPRSAKGYLELTGATLNNLKQVHVRIPLGTLTVVTGVSGSGKSSLICQTLQPALARKLNKAEALPGPYLQLLGDDVLTKLIAIDQTPIGRTPRSNPATYIKVFDDIRQLFASLPESCAKGFTPGRFSFNVQEGSCHQCKGMGMIRIDMDFMDDQWVECPACQNKRFDSQTLSVTYKGRTIHDVLEMTVDEALELFQAHPLIAKKLGVLKEVGLHYLTLGQSSTTLSGGEAQRIKLSKELAKPARGHTIYILDEPTTGLHFHDIAALTALLQRLVDAGHTVVVIEHNLDLIKEADWIIDMGPEAGSKGGEIVACGCPRTLALGHSPTAVALAAHLKPAHMPKSSPKKEGSFCKTLKVIGAEQHNLKQVSVEIPRGAITVCTGPSGSGKSSFAFDTVYAEGQRRYSESLSAYARQFVKQMPKPKVKGVSGLSPAIAIEQKVHAGNPRSTVGTQTEIYDYLRVLYAKMGQRICPQTGKILIQDTLDTITSKLLAFQGNRAIILAPVKISTTFEALCTALLKEGFLRLYMTGQLYELDSPIAYDSLQHPDLYVVIDRLKISENQKTRLFEAIQKGCDKGKGEVIALIDDHVHRFTLDTARLTPHHFSFNHTEGMCLECQGLGVLYGAHCEKQEALMQLSTMQLCEHFFTHVQLPDLFDFFEKLGIDLNLPIEQLSASHRTLLLKGSSLPIKLKKLTLHWQGFDTVLAWLSKYGQPELKSALLPLLEPFTCPSCQGARLNDIARHVFIQDLSLPALCQLPLIPVQNFCAKLEDKEGVLEEVLLQIQSRLQFLIAVGVDYLSLDRSAPTLSNGESQRIRLARQLGQELTGVLYVLDEPTVGLHPQDNKKLHEALLKLKQLGNTLLVVEHDPMIMAIGDKIIEFGPQAGKQGGQIVFEGAYDKLLEHGQTLTGAYLSHKRTLPYRKSPHKTFDYLQLDNLNQNNLKDLSIKMPYGSLLGCLTGVSGSGKSTLLEVIYQQTKALNLFESVIYIDQNPIGQTARADVGTYSDVISSLRQFYAKLPQAATLGLQPKNFSTNHKKGMCTHCEGMGYKKVERLFLPPVRVTCEQCHGLRLNPMSLKVQYKDLNFGQILQLTVDQAYELFSVIPKVKRQLGSLQAVGLGYLTLGQEVATLSGGEAQRLKLSFELSARTRGQTLYLLDEPTTGLHMDDIAKLLHVIYKLIDKGHTFYVIEHNLEFIQAADIIFDMGPGAGEKGGEIIACGTPKEVARNPHSITGKFLKDLI
jgi:excinuclease ABC subunit A